LFKSHDIYLHTKIYEKDIIDSSTYSNWRKIARGNETIINKQLLYTIIEVVRIYYFISLVCFLFFFKKNLLFYFILFYISTFSLLKIEIHNLFWFALQIDWSHNSCDGLTWLTRVFFLSFFYYSINTIYFNCVFFNFKSIFISLILYSTFNLLEIKLHDLLWFTLYIISSVSKPCHRFDRFT